MLDVTIEIEPVSVLGVICCGNYLAFQVAVPGESVGGEVQTLNLRDGLHLYKEAYQLFR